MLIQKIGLRDESIQELEALAQEYQDCVPVLMGFAEACLSYVRELYEKQMLNSARDLCEEAASALTTLVEVHYKYRCWSSHDK